VFIFSFSFLQEWQWSLGAAAIFLAWIELVLFLQKFPALGIYVVMFKDILNTFIQFFIVFVLFIIAFALGFYTLLQNQVMCCKYK
jgi:transient receptor potential cation channel subfamily A protein 1